MYNRTMRCAPTQTRRPVIPFCEPVVGLGSGAVAESVRIAEKCETAWVTVPAGGSGCDAARGMVKLSVPVVNNELPVITVGTLPASATIQQRVNAIAMLESDPYNPATRFRQYFPPAPLPYVCPERIPNNDPKPSTRECLPIQRFKTSADEAREEAAEAKAKADAEAATDSGAGAGDAEGSG
jgi:hypothetical protein